MARATGRHSRIPQTIVAPGSAVHKGVLCRFGCGGYSQQFAGSVFDYAQILPIRYGCYRFYRVYHR